MTPARQPRSNPATQTGRQHNHQLHQPDRQPSSQPVSRKAISPLPVDVPQTPHRRYPGSSPRPLSPRLSVTACVTVRIHRLTGPALPICKITGFCPDPGRSALREPPPHVIHAPPTRSAAQPVPCHSRRGPLASVGDDTPGQPLAPTRSIASSSPSKAASGGRRRTGQPEEETQGNDPGSLFATAGVSGGEYSIEEYGGGSQPGCADHRAPLTNRRGVGETIPKESQLTIWRVIQPPTDGHPARSCVCVSRGGTRKTAPLIPRAKSQVGDNGP